MGDSTSASGPARGNNDVRSGDASGSFIDISATSTGVLVERAIEGDATAFDELLTHVSGRLCAIAHRMISAYPQVRRWEETEDVLQEALIRLQRALKEVKPDSVAGFFGLVTTLVRRTLIDFARHYYGVYGIGAKHQSGQLEQNSQGEMLVERLGKSEPPEDLDDWSAFHDAIEKLPDDERETFGLVWYAGLTQSHVGKVLGISSRTVIRRMNRARIMLNNLLTGQQPPV